MSKFLFVTPKDANSHLKGPYSSHQSVINLLIWLLNAHARVRRFASYACTIPHQNLAIMTKISFGS